jgi:hypothetical protein
MDTALQAVPPIDASTRPINLSVGVAALYLGVSESYLNKLRCVGGGPVFIKIGRRVVYSMKDLDQWLSERRRASTSCDANAADAGILA